MRHTTIVTECKVPRTSVISSRHPRTFLSEVQTPFEVLNFNYIRPLLTDASEILVDDSGTFYLTW